MSNVAYRRYATRDIKSGGGAQISGVVRELTTPVAGRDVALLDGESLELRRTTRSGSNGAYSFPNVAEGRSWVVLAFDPNGAYNAVVADRVQT